MSGVPLDAWFWAPLLLAIGFGSGWACGYVSGMWVALGRLIEAVGKRDA